MRELTADELAIAMSDLKKALSLSYVDADGIITAYEYNSTAKVIPLMVKALALIRQEESEGDDGSN